MKVKLRMLNILNMIKASDLYEGDKITDNNSKEYFVVYNRCYAPVKRIILRECGTVYNLILFYGEDAEYAKNTFGIDLLG